MIFDGKYVPDPRDPDFYRKFLRDQRQQERDRSQRMDFIALRAKSCRIVLRDVKYNEFIGFATHIGHGILLTARHVLNGFSCKDLLAYRDDGKLLDPGLGLLEDGAIFNMDYALLYLPDAKTIHTMQFTADLPNEESLFACLGLSTKIGIVPPYPEQAIKRFETGLVTGLGYSGAPYINENGEMFGFHLSGYAANSMWAGLSTSITLSELSDNAPVESILNLYFDENDVDDEAFDERYFFDDDFTGSILSIGQIDESARNEALGSTPQLDTITGTQVLLRYFLKKNPDDPMLTKARWKGDSKFTPVEKNFLNNFKNPINAGFVETYYTFRSISDFKNHKDYMTLYKLLARTDEWQVYVRMPIGGDVTRTRHEWTDLSKKKKPGSPTRGFQMGHKMGAVEYWAYGAGKKNTEGWLRDERIPTIDRGKYNTPKKLTDKIKALEERYSNYRKPGCMEYSYKYSKVHGEFMKEPWNYHFQWWEVNQHDGRIAGQKTRYQNYTPTGYKWKDQRLVKK